jgi:hypothetical protein
MIYGNGERDPPQQIAMYTLSRFCAKHVDFQLVFPTDFRLTGALLGNSPVDNNILSQKKLPMAHI